MGFFSEAGEITCSYFKGKEQLDVDGQNVVDNGYTRAGHRRRGSKPYARRTDDGQVLNGVAAALY